ncbi:MAG: NACHT domain-containing protein [Caldilinea sp. CFX5]|nr:NACHT domain-containing protein [Caldilinea sp. CFX5]
MDIWNQLSPELRDFLFSAATDATGGLIGNFVDSLLRSGGRRLRERFAKPETEQALERAAGAAITAVIADWQQAHPDYADLWARFGAWLLNPAVLTEFRTLLTPSADATFDMELLRDEFEAAGLDVAHLGDDDFDGLIQAIVGEFYAVAATESVLEGSLQIGLLRQMADTMGALERLVARQNSLGRRSLGQLEWLNLVAARVADGHDETNLLLREMLVVLRENRPQAVPDLQRFYEQIRQLLSRADLGDFYDVELGERAYGVAIGDHARVEITNDFAQVQQLLTEIRDHLIAAQPGLTHDELVVIERHYRQSLIDRFEKLTFRGITPSGTALSLNLADVYVELKAVADIPEAADTYSAEERRLLLEAGERGELAQQEIVARLDVLRLERWRSDARRQREEGNRFQRRSIGEMVADPRQRGLVILGDPGSGKSTLLHYLALIYAGERQQIKTMRLLEKTLPIFVPLAAYDDHLRRTAQAIPLGEFLAIYYEKWRNLPSLAPLFRAALEQGQALLLFDGLDEVLETATRQFVAEQAGTLIQRWQGRGNRFVVTSRVVGYREARLPGDLPHVTVLDFGRPEIETFAHQWCRAYEVWAAGRETPTALQQAATEEAALLDDVRSNPSVEQLAANPLLLTMLALLRRQVGKLPDRRIELYERYTRTLIDNREQERSRGARQQSPSRFDPHRAIAHLMDLALWLQMHRPSGTARRIDLERALVDICLHYDGHTPSQVTEKMLIQARKDAEAFLTDMRHFAGLLGERGRDAFGFLHLTFQEYFAGRALARMDAEQRWAVLQPRLHLPRWREPILLCAGQLGVIEQRRDLVTDLIQRIVNAHNDHEELLHRDLFLAAAAMADDVGINQSLYQILYEQLAALHTDPNPTIQAFAINGLAHLARLGQNQAEKLLLNSLADTNLQLSIIRNTKPFFTEEKGFALRKAISIKLNDNDWLVRQAVVQALAGLVIHDPAICDAILTVLDDRAGAIRRTAMQALIGLLDINAPIRNTIVDKLNASNWSVRQTAVAALASLVKNDPIVRDAIFNMFSDENSEVRCEVVQTLAVLVQSDPFVRDEILTKLADSAYEVRQAAVQALASLTQSDILVRDAILNLLNDDDDHYGVVRAAAVEALAVLSQSDMFIRGTMLNMLNDDDDHYGVVRAAVVNGLKGLVSNNTILYNTILAMLDEDNDPLGFVRHASVQALKSLGSIDDNAYQTITNHLLGNTWHKQAETITILGQLVNTDASVRDAILTMLDDSNFSVQQAAIQALTGVISTDSSVRDAILIMLDANNTFARQAAIQALTCLLQSDTRVFDAFMAKLDDSDWRIRKAVVEALTSLVDNNDTVHNIILTRLNDRDWQVRKTAVLALAGTVNTNTTVRDTILAILNNDSINEFIRGASVQVLANLVKSDDVVHNAIITRLDDRHWQVRQAAVQALTDLVSTDDAIRNVVVIKLNDDDASVRQAAVQALAYMISIDGNMRDVIFAKLHDHGWQVRQAAVQALTGLVNTDNTVRDAIVTMLNDDDFDVRQAAILALADAVGTDATVRDAITSRFRGDNYGIVKQKALQVLLNNGIDENLELYELINWLGVAYETLPDRPEDDQKCIRQFRAWLAKYIAVRIPEKPDVLFKVVSLLDSPAWPVRCGATLVLLNLPDGPPTDLMPQLLALLHDERGEESWLKRLDMAGLLINDCDVELSQLAIETALEALDYATQPWYHLPQSGPAVRKQAATILGQLEPLYRNDKVFAKVAQVMQTDQDPEVRDAAYGALLRLAAAPEATAEG